MKQTKWILFAAALTLNAACAKKSTEAKAAVSLETNTAVESAMKALNEVSGNADVSVQPSSANAKLQGAVKLCTEIAALAQCDNGVKLATYDSCTPLFTTGTLEGQVQLSYSELNCSLNASGSNVTRTYELSYTTRDGYIIEVSSADHQDYAGLQIGGGGRLTAEGGGAFKAEVLGQRRKLIGRAGQVIVDQSVRTSSEVNVSAVVDNARILDGGSVEVSHNRAEYTSKFKPHQLKFSANCCYPVSGSLDVEYAGSVNGTAQITFQGCGHAELVGASGAASLTLNECQ